MVTVEDVHRYDFPPGQDLIATFTDGITVRGYFQHVSPDLGGCLVLEVTTDDHTWDTHLGLEEMRTVRLAPPQTEALF